jgi:class 3 adenylate cyclase
MGFTAQAAQLPVEQVFVLLAELFGEFDNLSLALGVTKIETIGDAYWAMTGAMYRDATQEDAIALAKLAFGMQAASTKIFPFGPEQPPIKQRIGLHVGPAIGGLVGATMPR